MSLFTRLRAPALLVAALAALLVFAGNASAETRSGESSSPLNIGTLSPETTLVKGSASYESTSGSVRFDITTAGAPQSSSTATMFVLLFTPPAEAECNPLAFLSLEEGGTSTLEKWIPLVEIINEYKEPTAEAVALSSPSELSGSPTFMPVSKSVSGTTTTLSLASSTMANRAYSCALVATLGTGGSLMAFPIKAPPPPPPAPAPAPAPAAFSITKPKTQTLKVGKWKTVKVKVTNAGATASVEGSLRLKPVKGVNVKPETQKLPVLAPGGSWSVPVKVQLTKQAKKKSTLKLTGSATGATTGTGSLVLKLKK